MKAIMDRVYLEDGLVNPGVPDRIVPPLLRYAKPVHTAVKVDLFIPGCPPSARMW